MTKQRDTTIVLSEEYKSMIDNMLDEETNGEAVYVSAEKIKNRFLNQGRDLQ